MTEQDLLEQQTKEMKFRLILLLSIAISTASQAQGKYGGGDGDGYDSQSFSSTVTSIINLENQELQIFPNPVKDVITIQYFENDGKNLVILDAVGRVVLKREVITSEIRISHLPAGLYYVRIGRKTKKFVKQ